MIATINDEIRANGNFAYYGDRQHFGIAFTRHRDSDALERSNFRVAVAAMPQGDKNETWAIERASHFLAGWVEYLLVEPNSAAWTIAEELQARLEDYPVLDENDYGELEAEELEDELYIALIDSGWSLVDEGTMDTVLECDECGYRERFSDRESALAFLYDREGHDAHSEGKE
jgi:hypothetical protein